MLEDIIFALLAGLILAAVFYRLKQPIIAAYILAGMVIGPNALGIVSDIKTINILAEIGVIFLLFSVGLEFSFSKIKEVGLVSIIISLSGIISLAVFGYLFAIAFGLSYLEAIILGSALCISSTAVVAKVLVDMKKLQESFVPKALGVLIVEDVVIVLFMAFIGSIGSVNTDTIFNVLGRLFVLFIVSAVLKKSMPEIFRFLDHYLNKELATLSIFGFALTIALLSNMLGFSYALGGLLAGMILADYKEFERFSKEITSMRDFFAMLFFIAIGMLVDPKDIAANAELILLLTAMVVLLKISSRTIPAFLLGINPKDALAIGLALVQIGEFSIIIVKQGVDAGMASELMYSIVASVIIITTVLTPYSIKYSDSIYNALVRTVPVTAKNFGIILRTGFSKNVSDVYKSIIALIFLFLSMFTLTYFTELTVFLEPSMGRAAVAPPAAIIVAFALASLLIVRNAIKSFSKTLSQSYSVNENITSKFSRDAFLIFFLIVLLYFSLLLLVETGEPKYLIIISAVLLLAIYRTFSLFRKSLREAECEFGICGIDNIFANIEAFMLPENAYAVGKRINELNLGEVRVISIKRGNRAITSPEDEVLRAGDLILLFGTPENREIAKKILVEGEVVKTSLPSQQ